MKKLSKTTILVFLILIGNLFLTNLTAQSTVVSNSDFENLQNEWKGDLQYLNYRDDESKFTIPCTMKTNFKKGKLHFAIIFDEMKNGKKMTSESNIYISKDGSFLVMDGENWKIKSNEKQENQLKIIATKRGDDNDRPSDLRMTFTFQKGKSLIWKKDVKYDGTTSFFNRNQFSFTL